MNKLVFVLLFIASPLLARGGPKYAHSELSSKLDDEISHIYEDMEQNLYNGGRISSGTIFNLTVTTLTYTTLIPALKVIQYQSGTSTTGTTTTSSTFQDTNLTVSITPTKTSSKILIMATGHITVNGNAKNAEATILKDGSNILGAEGQGYVYLNTGTTISEAAVPCSLLYIDSPATTSATTYSIGLRSVDNVTTVKWSATNTTTQFIVVMELAG